MKKKINITAEGHRADIGDLLINRIIPNRYIDAVGPFVFLDHALPMLHPSNEPTRKANGTGAHPHRGIATLTYIFNGEAAHLDSKGHYAKVQSGGVQWMKAGNGIIHDEVLNVDSKSSSRLTHAFQFWINLPSKNKAENPEYLALQETDIPKKELDKNSGWLKVIAGNYGNLISKIPSYTKQFLYHVHLEGKKQFSFEIEKSWECAAFLPKNSIIINDVEMKKGEFFLFEIDGEEIEISNTHPEAIDVILFGGEPYTEPIVAQGPFVMNTEHEISEAYNDFYNGKYGEIKYK